MGKRGGGSEEREKVPHPLNIILSYEYINFIIKQLIKIIYYLVYLK